MLGEVFYWVFNMSITAALTGVLIMLVRLIKKVPRRITAFLWIVPFFRMTIPIGLDSPYSFMSLISKITTKTVVVFQPNDDISFSMINSVRGANSYFPITYKTNTLEDVFSVASVIWVIVFLAIILMMAVIYITTLYELRDSTCLRDNIYFSEKVTSPAVYGIVKPKIILPLSYKDRNINLVILHEKAHIRGLDNLWRMIAFLIVAIHWFNPFSWIFLKAFLADLELSCDERVLVKIGADRSKEYASALLECRRGTTVFASAFGGAKIRTRIENILSFRKLTWISLAVFSVLGGVILYVLLTNAG
ncbi:MAG: M56 family metallopeptidase [Ruminococcaceae bacterium]|nr:M56 family metallopeptidase [Oscillospiraceae bacterium]